MASNRPKVGDRAAAETALTLARDRYAEEFAITDRIEGKARGLMTVGGATFAVAQAVAIPLVTDASSPSRLLLGSTLAFLLIGAGALLYGLINAQRVWAARKQMAISGDLIETMCQGQIAADGAAVAAHHLNEIIELRYKDNLERAAILDRVSTGWILCISASIVELVVAGAARLLG